MEISNINMDNIEDMASGHILCESDFYLLKKIMTFTWVKAM